MTNPDPESLPALRKAVARNPADFIAWVMLSDAELDARDADAVSYTHLDVYKRQLPTSAVSSPEESCNCLSLSC